MARRHGLLGKLGWLTGLLIAGIVVACEEGDNITNIGTTGEAPTVVAHVRGRVYDAISLTPIGQCRVAIDGAQSETMTLGDGSFETGALGAGEHELAFEVDGYAVASTVVTVPIDKTAERDYSIFIEIPMLPLSASLVGLVSGAQEDGPLGNVPVRVAEIGWESSRVRYCLDSGLPETTTDDNGRFSFRALPRGKVELLVPSLDLNEDGVPEYGASWTTIDLQCCDSTFAVIVMEPARSGRLVLYSSLASGRLNAGEEIRLIFSVPLRSTTTSLRIKNTGHPVWYDEEVPLQWLSDIEAVGTAPGNLVAGEYNATLFYDDPWNGDNRWIQWFVQVGDGWGPNRVPPISDLRLAESQGGINFDTREFMLEWSAVEGVRGYEIYAKDDRWNMSWEQIGENLTDFPFGTVEQRVILPEEFDRFSSDAIQTPLSGTTLWLGVIPMGAPVSYLDSLGSTVMIQDEVKPGVSRVFQVGDARNTGGETQELRVYVAFTEHVDPSEMEVSVDVLEAGGDPGFRLDDEDAEWVTSVDLMSGFFKFEVPPVRDGTGDIVRIRFQRLVDLSGNASLDVAAGDLLLGGGTHERWDFETGPEGWSVEGSNVWEWGTPTSGPGSAYSGVRCWGTRLESYYPDDAVSKLVSPPVMIPDEEGARLLFWHWYRFDYGDRGRIILRREGQETELVTYSGSGGSEWRRVELDLGDFRGEFVQIVFQFESDHYSRDYGWYVDAIELGGSSF
jgi:hypothetical protein